MNDTKTTELLSIIDLLIKELDKNNISCDKIKQIKNLLSSKKLVSNFEIKQKIIFDMRPVYDNGYSTIEIDDLLEKIYVLIDE